MNRIGFTFSGESRYSDVTSFMDSYGTEVSIRNKVVYRGPLYYLKYDETGSTSSLFPTIDRTINVVLFGLDAPIDLEGIRDQHPRWPFFVDSDLAITIIVGDQFWTFLFSPGKLYEKRELPEESVATATQPR